MRIDHSEFQKLCNKWFVCTLLPSPFVPPTISFKEKKKMSKKTKKKEEKRRNMRKRRSDER